MTLRRAIARIVAHEDLNFLLTNRIPRAALTRFMGWWSRIENPLVCSASLAVWKLFSDLDLREARNAHFKSLHDCFTRELKVDARPIDRAPGTLISPCDALLGASGTVERGSVLQAKGYPYPLSDLLNDEELTRYYEGGCYLTLRLTSSMYHRFHAPADCRVERVDYIFGDTWNVNPIALQRIEKLFCKNERAVIRCRLPAGQLVTLVPVAAILVASMRLTFLDVLLHLKYRGPNVIPCHAALRRGEQMGWFEHGSTIILFVPPDVRLQPGLEPGKRLQMGEVIMRLD